MRYIMTKDGCDRLLTLIQTDKFICHTLLFNFNAYLNVTIKSFVYPSKNKYTTTH